FDGGGPQAYMRHVTDAGEDGDLVWTHATEDTTEANFGQWSLFFAEAGHYRVEGYTDARYAESKKAIYAVPPADPHRALPPDQTAADGWQTLGEVDFAAGGHQWIHLADNTGEPVAAQVQLVFDAVRITRLDAPTDPGTMDPPQNSGCSTSNRGGGAGAGVLLA